MYRVVPIHLLLEACGLEVVAALLGGVASSSALSCQAFQGGVLLVCDRDDLGEVIVGAFLVQR